MNFQAVKQANGQNVTMFGTFSEIGGVELNQNKKQVCKCQITDDAGEKHLVRLYNQNMPTLALLNMRQQFTLSLYQGNYQGTPYTGFSGFWDDRAQVNQPAPQAPQGVPQSPQQPAQRPNVPQPAPQRSNMPQREPDWDAIAKGKVRHGIVCAGIQFGSIICKSIPDVDFWTEYVMTGTEPMVAADNPEQTTTEWETCGGCGQGIDHCQCEPKFQG